MEECVLRKWMPPLPDKVNKHFFLQIIDITYYYYRYTLSIELGVRVMVFNTTFNNISMRLY